MFKKQEKKAICLGAGFGGMAAALRLRALGYQVTLIDRMGQLGGKAQVYKQGRFSFDAGPTVVTAPFLIEELFALFGKQLKDYLELIPLDLWYRYSFEDGRTLDYGQDLEKTFDQIRQFNPYDVQGYQNLLHFSGKIFEVGFEQLACKPFHRFLSLIKTLPDLIRLKSYLSVYRLVSRYIGDDALRRAFSVSPLLVGGNPFSTTSIYALIHFLERKWGVHFPKGGMGALVNALGKLLEEEQVDIALKTTVKEIIVRDGKAVGVETEDGKQLPADLVVVNGDPSFVYKHLIDRSVRKKWTNQRIDKLHYSMGLFVLYFGTTKTYPDVAHHTIVFGKGYKQLLEEIFNQKTLSDDVSLYLHRPTATDPNLAPEGCDSFYALVPVPHLDGEIDWEKVGPPFQEKLLQLIEKRILPGLQDHLEASFYVTPERFREDYLSEKGAGFSVAPIFRQSAYFRFHNRSEEVKSLYLVGAGTHPGAGLPGVLSSAKVVEEILKGGRR